MSGEYQTIRQEPILHKGAAICQGHARALTRQCIPDNDVSLQLYKMPADLARRISRRSGAAAAA